MNANNAPTLPVGSESHGTNATTATSAEQTPGQTKAAPGVAGLAAIPAAGLIHYLARRHLQVHRSPANVPDMVQAALTWLDHFEATTGYEAVLLKNGDQRRSLPCRTSLKHHVKRLLQAWSKQSASAPAMPAPTVRRAIALRSSDRRSILASIAAAGFQVVRAPGSALAQAAVWQRRGLVDAVVTSDRHAFLFGATRVCLSYHHPHQATTEEAHWAGFGAESWSDLLAAHILAGRTALVRRFPGVGSPTKALAEMRKNGGFQPWMESLGPQGQPWLEAHPKMLHPTICTCPPLKPCLCGSGRRPIHGKTDSAPPAAQAATSAVLQSSTLEGAPPASQEPVSVAVA